MRGLVSVHNAAFEMLEKRSAPLLSTLARLVFAATLLMYFWKSAWTKLGDGALGFLFPSDGAYVQIFPRAMEAAGYDSSALGPFHWLVALTGTWAEFLLPALLVLGLMTRLSALGMIVFVFVQTTTDIVGHGATDARTLGAWFDAAPDSVILDQRALWVFLLAVSMTLGGGPLSLDRLTDRLK